MGGKPKTAVDKRITPEFRAQAGKGRPKGVPNKATKAIKEMIVQALDKAGGVNYLLEQSQKNPTAFLSLVAKVLPLQLTGEDGGAIQIQKIERAFVHPGKA